MGASRSNSNNLAKRNTINLRVENLILLNKKTRGLFYSLAILVLIAPLIFIVMSYRDVAVTESAAKTSSVVSSEIKNYVESSENDFERALDISGRSAVASSVNFVVANGAPLANSTAALETLILNGSLNGIYLPLMQGNSITNWTAKMAAKGSKYFMNTSAGVNYVSVNQTNAFYLDVSSSITINATIDEYGTKISKTYLKTIQIPLDGVEDPLYPLNSNGLIERVMAANTSTLSSAASLDSFVTSKQYVQSSAGPSFLDRLEGRTAYNRGVGFESIININDFIAQGLTIKEGKTMVDYIYFSNTSSTGTTVSGSALAWLLIDAASKTRYGVT